MPIIDSHTHIVPPAIVADRARYAARDAYFAALHASPRARLATGDDLLETLEQGGIESALTCGWAFREVALCRACNDYTLAAATGSRARLLPFAVVNPATAEGLREASRCLANGFLGLGELMPAGQGYDLDHPGLDALLHLAREARAPVLLHVNEPLGHAYPGKGPHGPAEALRLIQRHPAVDLILAHWGGGLCFYELMPEVEAACARVYYDTAASHLLYNEAIYDRMLAQTPGRILWGSDYPLASPRHDLARIRKLGLSSQDEAGLVGGNLASLLGIRTDEARP